MKTHNKKPVLRVRTGTKAGGLSLNHGLRVRTGTKAGGMKFNHTVRVRARAIRS